MTMNYNTFPAGFEDLYNTLLFLPEYNLKDDFINNDNDLSENKLVIEDDNFSIISIEDSLDINNDNDLSENKLVIEDDNFSIISIEDSLDENSLLIDNSIKQDKIYNDKFLRVQEKLKEYNILVDYDDNIIIKINDNISTFESIEDLYEFESLFFIFLEKKKTLKKKNKKSKVLFNESLNEILDKYKNFELELKNILKFNVKDKLEKVDIENDDLKNIIVKNFEDYIDKLDNLYNILDESINYYENNKYIDNTEEECALNKYIVENEIKKVDLNYSNLNNKIKEFKEYIVESKNFDINFDINFDNYDDLIKKYKKLKYRNLFYQFNNVEIMYFDDITLNQFFQLDVEKFETNKKIRNKFYEMKSNIFKHQEDSEKNYMKKYNLLTSFYENNEFLKEDNKKIMDKVKIRFDYFQRRNIRRKNDCLNNIRYMSKYFFDSIFKIDKKLHLKLRIDYLDYIFNLPETFFDMDFKNYEKNEIFISDFNDIFQKYNITFENHIYFLIKMSENMIEKYIDKIRN